MINNDAALSRVLTKLNGQFLNGHKYQGESWILDWDKTLSTKENLKNAVSEDRALNTLAQAKVISLTQKENWYRDEHYEDLELRGWDPHGDWDTADPGVKHYDYIFHVLSFDHDRFLQFCEQYDFDLGGSLRKSNTPVDHNTDVTSVEAGDVATLIFVEKTLKLSLSGATVTLKSFKNKKGFNYHLIKHAYTRPEEWLQKKDMGTHFSTILSPVKDWPKLIGLNGNIKDIFLNLDTKNQAIMLTKKKVLSSKEAEILRRLVNTKKAE
ncbi:MAG: hypothetical protein WAW80_03740 [Candidatus Saccharimonadales bacterium]